MRFALRTLRNNPRSVGGLWDVIPNLNERPRAFSRELGEALCTGLRPLRTLGPGAAATTFRVPLIHPATLRSPELANGLGIGLAITDICLSAHPRDHVAEHTIHFGVVPRLGGAEASLLVVLIR